ncbi:hypothetical protein CLV91_1690 [Maribacter vaceletii]|uniref:Anti-sigma-K factor rskA n=1 Tax=Maribacter vaceletii TaxID=1206816 RepID=A0A495E7R9_9FLAO|nr:anti-sigma factor [Maribacter vaceletii]RKR12978.1 hypothetical protein CLV91_1690 [Maribacter vaceletii]
MKNFKLTNVMLLALVVLVSSCSSDDLDDTPKSSALTLDINGLDNLGSDYLYEGWIIVNGAPVSTGTFSVDDNHTLSQSSFTLDAEVLESASDFVLTIEPNPDPSDAPADTKIFIGSFDGNSASLTTGTVAPSFDAITGKYIIATPTGTGAEEEKYSGVWFLDNSSGSPVAGLELPALEAGWKYEGWVVIDGVPLSTGTFTSVDTADDASPFSGSNPGPNYPGEDFLVNAPDGVTFPTDVRGKVAVISIEPYPDNSAAPFTLKPLFGMIPTDAMGVQEIGDYVTESFPTGTVSR